MVLHLPQLPGLSPLTTDSNTPAVRAVGWRRLLARPPGAIAHPLLVIAALALEVLLWGGDARTRLPGLTPEPWGVPIGLMIMAVVLLLSARSLTRTYWIVWGLSVAMAALYPGIEPFVGMLLVVFRIARSLPRRRALLYAAGTAGPWAMNTINAVNNGGTDLTGALIDVLLWASMTVVVWMIARYVHGQEELARARESAAIRSIQLAIQEERLRLARELHDVVSHSVSAVILQAAGARQSLRPDPALGRVLEAIESTSTAAARDLRGLLGLLGPATSESGSAQPGPRIDELSDLLATTRACGIDVALEVRGTPAPFDERRHLTAYRVVQEALTNVIRHGGTGSRATVEVTWSDSSLDLAVTSVAVAPPSAPIGGTSGRGLAGLRQRIEEVGGSLDSGPLGRTGYRLTARIPYA